MQNEPPSTAAQLQKRLKGILDSDRAILSPAALSEMRKRIVLALDDIMVIEEEKIEFQVGRDEGQRVLHLSLPIKQFIGEDKVDK